MLLPRVHDRCWGWRGATLVASALVGCQGPTIVVAPAHEPASAPAASTRRPAFLVEGGAPPATSLHADEAPPPAAIVGLEPPEAFDPADAAPPDPPCMPVSHPPTVEVTLSFSLGKLSLDPGLPSVTTLVATVIAPRAKLRHEIWSSPSPTSCSAKKDGDAMVVHCITDEGQVEGRSRVIGEKLVVETAESGPMQLPPIGAARAQPRPRRLSRVAEVKVPCGTKLLVRPATRSQ